MVTRWFMAAAAVAFLPLSAEAQVGTADLQDFELQSAQDLVDLCSAQPGSALYAEAKQFCYGFFSGVYFFHDALATGTDFGRIVCPEEQVTRDDAVDMFITWANNHPDELASDQPADALIRAAVDKWGRCQQ